VHRKKPDEEVVVGRGRRINAQEHEIEWHTQRMMKFSVSLAPKFVPVTSPEA
jgi:hypothetical protein